MDWYYAQDGRQLGPVAEMELTQLARTGVVTPETLVWHAGMAEWQTYRSTLTPSGFSATPKPAEAQRFCSSCGRSFAAADLAFVGESAVCASCKPAYVQRLRQGMATNTPQEFHYAGFWIRFVAVFIDGIILNIIQFALFSILRLPTAFSGRSFVSMTGVGLAESLSLAVGLTYYCFFWVRYGATPGKMALGLKVVNPDGGPIPAGQAVGRYFSLILSGLILCIGFMMAGWDDQKRALHDRIAGTRVIRIKS